MHFKVLVNFILVITEKCAEIHNDSPGLSVMTSEVKVHKLSPVANIINNINRRAAFVQALKSLARAPFSPITNLTK